MKKTAVASPDPIRAARLAWVAQTMRLLPVLAAQALRARRAS